MASLSNKGRILSSKLTLIGAIVLVLALYRFARPLFIPGITVITLLLLGDFFSRKLTQHRTLRRTNDRAEELKIEARKRGLVTDLRRFCYSESPSHLIELARRTIKAIEDLLTVWDQFELILNEKLKPGELTYSRYHTTARRLFNESLQQLKSIHPKLELLAAQPNRREVSEQTAKIDQLLSRMNLALAALNQLAVALTDLNTDPSRESPEEFERVIDELNALADQAKNYTI